MSIYLGNLSIEEIGRRLRRNEVVTVLARLVMRLYRVKDPVKDPVKVPIAGEEWCLKNDSPWPKPDQKPVKILDVKNGWVRYDMQGICFRDERMVIDSFLYCYRFHAGA